MKTFNKLFLLVIVLTLVIFSSNTALSGESPDEPRGTNILKAYQNSADMIAADGAIKSSPLTLRQNMIEVITLSSDIGSIMISNPAPVELIVENSRRVVLRPAEPGVTNVTIINKGGVIVYKRDIIVTQRGENYVRLTRYCTDNGCNEEDIYFCPDGCYEVKSLRDNTSGIAPITAVPAQPDDIGYQPVPGAYDAPMTYTPENIGEE